MAFDLVAVGLSRGWRCPAGARNTQRAVLADLVGDAARHNAAAMNSVVHFSVEKSLTDSRPIKISLRSPNRNVFFSR